MTRKQKILTSIISLAFLIPVASFALMQTYEADQYDGGGGGGGGGTVTTSSGVNFRTCFNDRDIALVLAEAKDPYKSSPAKDAERVPMCDHIQYQCLFSVRVDCTISPQGYSWKCINYNYDWDGNGFREGTRDLTGAYQTQCFIPKKKSDGTCSTVKGECLTGEKSTLASSTKEYSWTCYGTGGGASDYCVIPKTQVADGECGREKFVCSKGTPSLMSENDTKYTWTCLGEKKFDPDTNSEIKGKDKSCELLKQYKGVCSTTHFNCVKGTSTRPSTYSDRYTWSCAGYGANSITSCSENIVANGLCSSKEANRCEKGQPANNTTTNSGYKWSCTGIGGGQTVECSMPYKPVDGVCSSSHYRCASGEGINPLKTTNVWTWTCPGKYGGKAVSCSENMGVKKGSCSSVRNECIVGTTASITEDADGYKWTCIGPNNGGNVSCSERKKANGACAESEYGCLIGDLTGKRDTKTMKTWICSGIAGGKSEYCSVPKNATSTGDGVCNSKHYSCNNGVTKNKIETDKEWTWTCEGVSATSSAKCSEVKIEEDPDDKCLPSDTECHQKKCEGDKECEKKIEDCKGDLKCIDDIKKKKTSTGSDVCAPGDLACLLRKCNGDVACENALRKCKQGDIKCINEVLKNKNLRWGSQYKENNGVCSTSKIFSCVQGLQYDNIRDEDSYKWKCLGKKGGTDAVCKIDKPKDGICSTKSRNKCDVGTPAKIKETKTVWNWSCLGVGGGKATDCSMNIVPVDGACSNEGLACFEGKSSVPKLMGDWWEWTCSGAYGGTSTACYKEVKGKCSAKHYSCAAGKADSMIETEFGWSWKCRGANGDLTVGCFEEKPILKIKPAGTSSSSTKSIN